MYTNCVNCVYSIVYTKYAMSFLKGILNLVKLCCGGGGRLIRV